MAWVSYGLGLLPWTWRQMLLGLSVVPARLLAPAMRPAAADQHHPSNHHQRLLMQAGLMQQQQQQQCG
jgi:hypothetical protein